MKDFIFDLQRFDDSTVTLAAGETHADDNVIYTAGDDGAELKLTDGKVSGITSGSVVAKLNGDSSPAVTFDGSTPFDFKCTSWESVYGTKAIHVEGSGTASINYTGGSVTYSAQGASADAGELSVTGLISKVLPFDVKLDIPDSGMAFTVEGKTTTVNAPEKVNATLTFPETITTALENFKPLIGILLNVDEDTANKLYDVAYKLATSETTAQIEGTLSWNQDEKRLTMNEDSLMAINILDYALSLTAVGGNVDGLSFFYQMISETELSAGAKFTPSTDENAGLNLTFTKDSSKIYDGLLNLTAGAIDIDVVNAKASVEKDTAFTITTPDGNLVEFKFDDAASFTYSADENGLSTFTFGENDGKLEMTLYNGDKAILKAGVEINGALTIDTKNETIGVTKDTTTKITIGEYEATINVTTDTGITITPKDDKFYVTADEGNSAFDLKIVRGEYTVFEGNLDISGAIEFDTYAHSLSVSPGSMVTLTRDDTVTTLTATDDAGLAFSLEGDSITLTPNKGDGSLDITIEQDGNKVFEGNLEVTGGSIFIGDMGQTIGLSAGTSMAFTLGNYTLDITANDDASFGLGFLNDGSISITPQENDGSLDISISRGSTSIFSNTVSISGGSITFNPTTQLMTLTSGTTISLAFGDNYELTATATGDAASTISFTGNGITIKPQENDGSLDLTLGNKSGSMDANIEVLSGSFTLGQNGAITVAAGTELQIKFSDDYIINFKATDKAGGSISLGDDGITFAPNGDDGGLQLTVKRGDDTRSASLDVTGSVTYKLDGSISLTKGTVVKNVFDSGNILTITANTDASGSINFNPQTGLTITPSTPDALTATLTTGDLEVAKFTSIDGSITYSNGIVTASNGTSANLRVYDTWDTKLSTSGGTASIQFTDDRTVYTANDGATFTLDYLDDTTLEIQNGSFTDIYATETSDAIELVSVGSTFKANDEEFVFTLEKAGTYTLNGIGITTSEDNTQVLLSGDYDTVQFAADEDIKVSTIEGGKFFIVTPGKDTISFSTQESNNIEVSGGAVEFDNAPQKLSCTTGTTLSLTNDNVVSTLTAPEEISASYKVEEGIAYFALDDEATANILVTNDGTSTFAGTLTAGGVLSFNPATGTYGLTGANSSHGDGTNTFAEITTDNGYSINLATNDTTVVFVPKIADGKLELNFPNENKNAMAFTLGKDGETILERKLIVNGTIGVDNASQELSLTKDTVLSLSPDGENWMELTAKDDASGQLQFTDSGIRFAPNAGDGSLELNFTANNRQATIDVSAGAIILGNDGMMSLEEGTVANITWEDGTTLTITASDTGGSFGFDEQGLKVSSNGELSIDLTAGDLQTTMSELKGTIHYNAGKVLFDENSTLTATSSLGGQPTNITLESNGTGGYIEISANGTTYAAGTGALSVTWSRDVKESTFSINSGSVYIGHGIFQIAEGTDLSTDLKDLVPALYFTTTDAGTYTINGQTITTTAEDISMTATDDYMTFKTSDDAIAYDGMSFAGAGNVSLSTAGVVLGAGVEATGFGVDKSFILAEAGNVTADARIFELTEEVPTGITVTGAEDGFIFSRTNTEESEARFDDPDPDNVGKNFTEQFFLKNDDSYRVQTDLLGLQQIIGVSAPSTVNASATFGGEESYSIFDIVTDEEGTFDIAEKTYSINGDPEVEIKSRFEEGQASVLAFNDLNGTVSGDFTAHEVSINGSASAVQVFGDTEVSIVADENGFEILGLDKGASLKVSAADTYIVNGASIIADAGDIIVGTSTAAQPATLPAALADFMLHKTAAGYPAMAALAFHPDEENPPEPENYHSAEKWTTTSSDKLELSAIHYSPKKPTGKWVILVHGYGKSGASMNDAAKPYLSQGVDVLIIDQRAAGNSQGDWLTMGVAEANDLAVWTQEIAKTNANAQIILHGVSMGAATVMLGAALPETENLSAIIEDCGYDNIADVFATLMYAYGSELGVSGDYYELFDDVAAAAKTLDGGYDVSKATPIDSISEVTVPSLFIHGAADGAIPSTNADALYEASGAQNKTKLIIDGAGHAKSFEVDSKAYLAAVKNLIATSTTEIGASIDSAEDNKLLRGTIYDDTIANSGQKVTIEALGGSDSIDNSGSQVSISGGADDDSIYNEGMQVTIDAGKGDDLIVNDVDSSLTAAELGNSIKAGAGDDSIYNYHSYNPTLLGGAGDDFIVVSNGHKTFADGGTGNDTIIGVSQEGGWGMGNLATVLGGEGDDFINPIYSANASIDGGAGNDTIFANGESATIDGGTGNNLIVLTNNEGGVKGKFVVFNGNTTVESFNTGFESDLDPEMGEGTDTIYIDGDPAGVYFNDGVLVFANDNASLTMSDITTTAKVNIYHERRQMLNKGVFIAENDWYSVTSSDLSVNSGEEVYFVGPSANPNHGVDFSGISAALNVTMDTAYIDSKDYVPGTTTWINGVYSLKGGAGLTTITGSDKNDTIIAGAGDITINAAGGDDNISLNSSAALIKYAAGDGFDTIYGFNANSTLDISGEDYSTYKRGNDLLVDIGEGSLLLKNAAHLKDVNIIGTKLSSDKLAESFAPKHYSVVSADDSGEKNISLTGGDLAIVEATSAEVSISAGDDTVISQGENVTVSLTGGNTWLFPLAGNMSLQGYDHSTGTGFGTNRQDIPTAIEKGYIDFNDGRLLIGGANVYFPNSSELMNFFDIKGNLQKVGYASKADSLDAGKETADLIMDGKDSATLISGSGDDTITASGIGNAIDAGAGNNLISLESAKRDVNDGSVLVFDGDTTVEGFKTGFGFGTDTVYFNVSKYTDAPACDFKDDGLTLYNKNGRFTFDGMNETAKLNFYYAPDNKSVQGVFIANGDMYSVESTDLLGDADELYFVGASAQPNQGVDFSGIGDALNISLDTDYEADVPFWVNNVYSVVGGAGDTTITGSKLNDTIIAGTGETSIDGGRGRNQLIGQAGNEDKSGSTEFVVTGTNNAARNTISGFEFIEDGGDNPATADNLNLGMSGGNEVIDLKIKGNDLSMIVSGADGSRETVLLEGAAGQEFLVDRGQETETVAQIAASEVTVKNDYVDFYAATESNATVTIGDVSSAKVWLEAPDFSDGVEFVGDFAVIDARGSEAEVEMAGNNVANTIYGGLGNASMWGGAGIANDVMYGGSAHNEFYYEVGNGNDTIMSANNGDIIHLGATLEQIDFDKTNINASDIEVTFTDGGTLKINGTAEVSFSFDDNTTVKANRQTGQFE